MCKTSLAHALRCVAECISIHTWGLAREMSGALPKAWSWVRCQWRRRRGQWPLLLLLLQLL